jgi:hypothetical protein
LHPQASEDLPWNKGRCDGINLWPWDNSRGLSLIGEKQPLVDENGQKYAAPTTKAKPKKHSTGNDSRSPPPKGKQTFGRKSVTNNKNGRQPACSISPTTVR